MEPLKKLVVFFYECNNGKRFAPRQTNKRKQSNNYLAPSQPDKSLVFCVFIIRAFFRNFFLRKNRLSGDVPPHLAQPC